MPGAGEVSDDEPKAPASRAEADQKRWDERYRAGRGPLTAAISSWAASQRSHLAGGRALDAACGAGRYSIWLAGLGYQVDAVDISPVGLAHLREQVARLACADAILPICADLELWRPEPGAYDLVLVSLYLNRELLAPLQGAVKTGGLFLYTTYHTDLLLTHGDYNADFLLQPGELVALFEGWEIMAFEEQRWHPGAGRSACTASLLARKPRPA